MPTSPNYWVIIPAAGSGSRMQQDLPKQYLSVLGKTILEHTLSLFIDSAHIKQITVCLPADDQRFAKLSFPSKVVTTVGGDTRAQSVLNGLQAINASDDDWVLVHDAARPCLSKSALAKLITELADDELGGILAVPAKDTLKQATDDGKVAATVDRSRIWQAQTPQMFRYALLKDALSRALSAKANITDESSALEWAGLKPRLIEGEARNIKITRPDDLLLAEFLLSTIFTEA